MKPGQIYLRQRCFSRGDFIYILVEESTIVAEGLAIIKRGHKNGSTIELTTYEFWIHNISTIPSQQHALSIMLSNSVLSVCTDRTSW